MSGSEASRRAYRSPLRQQQAARTRRRIIEAATDLFSTRGFGGATMTDIANEADVSVESVHATGAKVTLLLESFRQAVDERTPWSLDGNADDALEGVVQLVEADHARTARIMLEVRHVALTDAKVAKAWTAQLEARREELRTRTEWLVASGVVAGDASTDLDLLTAAVSNVTSAETYVQLTSDWGFDADQYRAWLRRQLQGLRS